MTADEGETTMVQLAELVGVDLGGMKFGWPADMSENDALHTGEWWRICTVCKLAFGCHHRFACPPEGGREVHATHTKLHAAKEFRR